MNMINNLCDMITTGLNTKIDAGIGALSKTQ